MSASSQLKSLPAAREERWRILRNLIADWFGPLSGDDGWPNPVGPVELPAALREWYQLCGNRRDVWSAQDDFLLPFELQLRGDYLAVVVENQSCAYWGLRLAELEQEDPPIYVDMTADGDWELQSNTTSEFALHLLAYNLKWSKRIRLANGSGSPQTFELIREAYPRLAFPDWKWPQATRFFGTRDVVIEINGEDDFLWIWASARTESALESLFRLVQPSGIEWEANEPE